MNASTYPHHGTQKARLLAAMLAGRQINPLTAWREFGAYSLDQGSIDAAGEEGQRYVSDEREVLRQMRRAA